MNFREKFVTQAVICLMVFSVAKSVGMMDIELIKDMRNRTERLLCAHYTAEDITSAVSEFIEEAGNARRAVTAAVIEANENSRIEQSLGETDENGIQVVYAPAGGQVIGAGIDETAGMYVKISHDGIISVCGNMSTIAVLTGERVRKGDIIGTYDANSDSAFYFQTEGPGTNLKISA